MGFGAVHPSTWKAGRDHDVELRGPAVALGEPRTYPKVAIAGGQEKGVPLQAVPTSRCMTAVIHDQRAARALLGNA